MWAKRWWRIHWPGTAVWTSDECMSRAKTVLAPFPLISFGNQALWVLSQKVMEFPTRVYVEWLVPNQLGHSHLQTQWDSAILQPPKPRPFKCLLEHSLQSSVLYPLFIPCPLQEAQPHVGLVSSWLGSWTINTLRTTDVSLLPLSPHPVCLVHIPGSQFYSYHTSVLCLHFPSRLGPENLP